MSQSTEVAERDPWAQETLLPTSSKSFKELVSTGDYDAVEGYDLVEPDTLVGRQFIITKVRFNPGMGGDFVSCEATTRDDQAVVFNDGSTGIRRQIVKYLTVKGRIDPGKGDEQGSSDNCRYDNPYTEWAKGGEQAKEGFEISLLCPRGTRVSEYEWNGTIANTWYLA